MGNTRYMKKADNGTWEIRKEGHRRATARGRTKAEALKTARSAVRKEGGGEVHLMNHTGKVVEIDRVRRSRGRAAA
jgi:Uncharacterized protein conserved in bacteria (DUF2188)